MTANETLPRQDADQALGDDAPCIEEVRGVHDLRK